MIRLNWKEPSDVADVQALVQGAIDIEFATLPPYLYAAMTILPDTNAAAHDRVHAVLMQEMIHMCLACNIMNAIGGTVAINPPKLPGHLPGDVGGDLEVHLLRFSPAAMAQGMAIEQPVERIEPRLMAVAGDRSVTIGEYYMLLKAALLALPATAWTANRNQIGDQQYFQGQIFPVNDSADAAKAIDDIVSEGEGTPVTPEVKGSPLDFQNELAHYYRFWEVHENKVLQKDVDAGPGDSGYCWGAPLGVDWDAVYLAIDDPETFDFSGQPAEVQAAQARCNAAFTAMVDALTKAFGGAPDRLGVAIRAMFELRMAALAALNTAMPDGKVAGPAFLYIQSKAETPAQGEMA